jgi:hypothetical protein
MTEEERRQLLQKGYTHIICGEDKQPYNKGRGEYSIPKYVYDLFEKKFYLVPKEIIVR